MLHPNKPPLATVGRALTLIQVIFYLPLTLDVGGPDAFLALSASLASYYWALSSLRLVTKGTRVQWIGDLCAVFQFLVVPACLAVCWAVYCPPENNYFFVRWARSVGVNPTTSSTTAWSPHLHPATPPHLAAIVQAVRPILQRDTHPYLEYLFDVSSKGILLLARKVPIWWGGLLRMSSPLFSLLEGSATLVIIQLLGHGCRYVIATSLTRPSPSTASGSGGSGRSTPLALLSSIGLRGAEAWQLGFLLSSAIIYVISGWALFLSFEGVVARGGGASLMMGVSIASVGWLTAIAFALGKGNVIETALIFSYVSWNIFALSSASSLSFVSDPLALVRSFKGQVTMAYLDSLAPIVSARVPASLQSSVSDAFQLLKVTFGQSLTFLGAIASALPASVVVSLVYRLMVLYLASRVLPLLCGPSARTRTQEWPPRKRKRRRSRGGMRSSSSSSTTSSKGGSTYSSSSSSTGSSSSSSSSSSNSSSGSSSSDFDSDDGIAEKHTSVGSRPARRSSGRRSDEAEPFGSFISFVVSYSRLILIATYSHLLLLDQSHQTIWRFSTVSVTLVLWTMELLLGSSNDDVEFAGMWRS
ncbi:hypothetical protein BDZ90DRAFT_24481 [Jaminaea rosea]|uniref:ICE2-domain-containing protein n=1 Tax=Jaminaea rosea TaxID=1569628 RepID=A0A316UZR8_9BASI|nr:hypothetical protein BDZ90DRAFT_24481 [Jaminaea rosea]PWN30786.1 hypothetical protein BDZ90DRAFT_24481 [Jaminaea rosea]